MSNKKNVIILVLSHYEEPYVMLENCIKQTWSKTNLDNVNVIFYHGGGKESIKGDKIVIDYPEGYHNIGHKTIRAFEILLQNNNFDYIFRTNSSSYVNIEKLVQYLDDKPLNNFYHGVIGRHNDINFASGCGYFLSKDVVKKVVENKSNWPHQIIDDVAIAYLLRNIGIYPTPAPRLDITDTPVPDNVYDYFHFRCKTNGDRTGEVKIMNELKKIFSNMNDIKIEPNMYDLLCNTPSDINEHLPTIKKYASDCSTVTEMGTRFVISTWALVEANPKKITCYDINLNFFIQGKKNIEEVCQNKNIDFKFIEGDTLKIEIENTDLLFIDTLHRYEQLISELNRHAKNVNKYIILHDTVSFANVDEFIYLHASDIIKNTPSKKEGLIQAINDFLETEDGKKWKIHDVYTNNNGLTVLKKIN
jgi:signal peptidase I